jgi:phosphatidylserine/phosphatidylglycerophosphate/cardiolipin synthase-like enzyme
MMIVSSPHLIRTQHRSPAFQSFAIRKPQIGYLIDFFRANRRTHNKSFTADNQVRIIGGRNIGEGIGKVRSEAIR